MSEREREREREKERERCKYEHRHIVYIIHYMSIYGYIWYIVLVY